MLPIAQIALIALSGVSIVKAGPIWEQTQKLYATDEEEHNDFGFSVAMSGNTAVIGAPFDEDNGPRSGSAYVFDVTTGLQLFQLLPDDGEAFDNFGYSISVSGNTAVIGAPFDDDNGPRSGSAYVFDVTTGLQLFHLLPDDGEAYDNFGYSISVSGNTAVIGATLADGNGVNSGSAYIFDITTGLQLFKLVATDGAKGDRFGWSVAANGNTAVVGAQLSDGDISKSGSAYVFDVTTGLQLFKLVANDGAVNDEFGRSVAVCENLAVIGADLDDDSGNNSGSAYVFDVTTGKQLFKLLPQDGVAEAWFGYSVALSGNTAVIGARRDDDNGFRSGSVYVFDISTGRQLSKLLAKDGDTFDNFGWSVAMSGNTAVIGASRDDDFGPDSGSAYVFQQFDCINLAVNNLVAGQNAVFTITGGTPGTRAVTVYGTKAGQTIINNISNYCAIFGINGITQSKVLGGLNQVFDANGQISFNQPIPQGSAGTSVFFQSAMQGTCPNECTSSLVNMTIQ